MVSAMRLLVSGSSCLTYSMIFACMAKEAVCLAEQARLELVP